MVEIRKDKDGIFRKYKIKLMTCKEYLISQSRYVPVEKWDSFMTYAKQLIGDKTMTKEEWREFFLNY